MLTTPYTFQRRVDHFRDQRWLLDAVVKLVGSEFDRSRFQHRNALISPGHHEPVMGLPALVQRWGDMAHGFFRLVCRRELQARASLAQDHEVSARSTTLVPSA